MHGVLGQCLFFEKVFEFEKYLFVKAYAIKNVYLKVRLKGVQR